MASVSISHLVIFIASLLVASAVAGTLVTGVDRISESVGDRSIETSETIRTDIEIISDTGSDAVVQDDTIVALVKNTGSTSLDPDPRQLDVLLNGQYVPRQNVTVEPVTDDTWNGGDVVEVRIDTGANGDLEIDDSNRLTIIVNGNEALMRFRG